MAWQPVENVIGGRIYSVIRNQQSDLMQLDMAYLFGLVALSLHLQRVLAHDPVVLKYSRYAAMERVDHVHQGDHASAREHDVLRPQQAELLGLLRLALLVIAKTAISV
eukprot:290270-Pleurochrysis_carterae.AAC.1